ncbi:hypothetical protein Dsin_012136 [Dipteronia sinensis]|uniref:Uncharacterized protein n=1 Tax=Dipteronia sinensis TaxID=43782 RepID=A0AAE0E7R1_9ROSI|nr:hypothetical protein Dsin_012136 [Dipteronia sinensis]
METDGEYRRRSEEIGVGSMQIGGFMRWVNVDRRRSNFSIFFVSDLLKTEDIDASYLLQTEDIDKLEATACKDGKVRLKRLAVEADLKGWRWR